MRITKSTLLSLVSPTVGPSLGPNDFYQIDVAVNKPGTGRVIETVIVQARNQRIARRKAKTMVAKLLAAPIPSISNNPQLGQGTMPTLLGITNQASQNAVLSSPTTGAITGTIPPHGGMVSQVSTSSTAPSNVYYANVGTSSFIQGTSSINSLLSGNGQTGQTLIGNQILGTSITRKFAKKRFKDTSVFNGVFDQFGPNVKDIIEQNILLGIRAYIQSLKVRPNFKKRAEKRHNNIKKVSDFKFNPKEVDSYTIGPNVTLKLAGGAKLVTDDRCNFKILDRKAAIVYNGTFNREFNRYLNSSDLLEQFIKDLGLIGVTQSKVLKVPIHAFINWLILKSAEQDQTPTDAPKLEALPEIVELKAAPLDKKPRCLHCGHFLKENVIKLGLKHCNGVCMNRYVKKMTNYEKKEVCCID